jgi:hypothetical protein
MIITALVLTLLFVVALVGLLVAGVLGVAFLAVKLVLRILTLPFAMLGGFRHDRWRRRAW